MESLRYWISERSCCGCCTRIANSQVDVWSEPLANGTIDLRVSPDVYDDVTTTFRRHGIAYEILIHDLQRLIVEQQAEAEFHKRRRERLHLATGASRPRRASQGEDVRRGGEGSHLRRREDPEPGGIERGRNGTNETDSLTAADLAVFIDSYSTYDEIGEERESTVKPAIWIDAGIHAREWISPATAVFFIYSLIVGHGKDPVVTTLLTSFDWYIQPIINPDGYEYSHTTDRMWRKTRSRIAGRRCRGVDGNRNFDFQWTRECEGRRVCRGKNPCDDVFAGKTAFSEPETIAVANWILANKDRLKLYIALHSYSQLWLIPWGYTAEHAPDYDDLIRNARSAVSVLEAVDQTRYKIGSPAEILYSATGGSYDWVKGVAGIKYSYTIELRDTGNFGFLLPRSQIIPTGLETWAGVQKMALEVLNDQCWMFKRNCSTPTPAK